MPIAAPPLIRLRTPEANQPEYVIVLTVDGERKEYVIPITFSQLRSATEEHVKACMRYPVREVPAVG